MELELLDIRSFLPSLSDFSSALSESTSPSPPSTKPRACSALGRASGSVCKREREKETWKRFKTICLVFTYVSFKNPEQLRVFPHCP